MTTSEKGDGARRSKRAGDATRKTATRRRGEGSVDPNAPYWLWGAHAAGAALANPEREVLEVWATKNAADKLSADQVARADLKDASPKDIAQKLPDAAVHQGLAVRVRPLEGLTLDEVAQTDGPIVLLDEVTDPQNVGAIFRVAVAFGAVGVVLQSRRSAAINGTLAKAAAGALETVAEVRCVNLARAIDALRDADWNVVGLAGESATPIDEAVSPSRGKLALVIGAEGKGIRPSVANACSTLARIPISAAMESLNVSNAGAIALYEASRSRLG